jgi:site-specific recombinase XerD
MPGWKMSTGARASCILSRVNLAMDGPCRCPQMQAACSQNTFVMSGPKPSIARSSLPLSRRGRPLAVCGTSNFVKVFLNKLGLDAPGRGAHSFRHTAATLMVSNGVPVKDVADVLGHRSLQSTGIYIELDKPSLRDVALPWRGGVR